MSAFKHLSFAVKSDVGHKRKNNEDAFGTFPEHGVWCVADGMGGGDDGEVASAAVIRAVETFCTGNPMPKSGAYSGLDVANGVVTAVNSASAWIYNRAKGKGLKGCGSTFVGIVFNAVKPSEAIALHAGDSRLYRIRGKDIKQITRDHSAAEMIGAKDDAEVNPMFRGMILRAVGIQRSVEIDFTPFPLKQGDTILICSDGLSRMVPDKQIAAIVREYGDDVEKAVTALITAANKAGGIDNITAELIRVGELPQPLLTVAMTIPDGERAVESSLQGGEGSTFDTAGTGEDVGLPISSVTIATTGDTAPCGPEMRPSGGGHGRRTVLIGGGVALIMLIAVVIALLPFGKRESLEDVERAVAELQRKTFEEQQRLLAERDRIVECNRMAEEKRKAEEMRIAEVKRKADAEAARVAHDRQMAEMEQRLQREKQEEAERRLAEEKRLAEAKRLADERRKAEERRLAEEKRQAKEREAKERSAKRAAEAAEAVARLGSSESYGGFLLILRRKVWPGKANAKMFEPLDRVRRRLKGYAPGDGTFAISVVDMVREMQKLAKILAADLDSYIDEADELYQGKKVLALERLKGLSEELAHGDPADPEIQLVCVKWFEEGAKAPL